MAIGKPLENGPAAIIRKTRWVEFHHWKRKTQDMTLQNILSAGPFEGLHRTIQQFSADRAERLKARAVYDRTWRELWAMSDRERTELGLHSSDIPRMASEAAAMSRKTS